MINYVVLGQKNILDLVALAKFQEQDYSFLVHLENQASNANLPEAIAAQIKSLGSDQLDLLTEDLLDFETFDDLEQWLNTL